MLPCLLRLLLCLCLVANTATGAWASVGMAMPDRVMPQAATHTVQAHVAAAMPCHEAMPAADAARLPDTTRHPHAHASDCCKLGSCDCLQHCNLALLTLPAVPTGMPGRSAVPAALDAGRGSPAHEQPVRPPIG
ncbi:copper homeostasis protein [Xanthomonas pisi DSM 18956]|uniref:Copper homeostasis protein n=1 Tax=Xanthomonas pisi TaxID=56457 RepID=A0A2S7D362_9XANT|nr:CopL family metal-binding regulatory protein [Xanthomonas pisi]KLD71682.1 copper homeostasis protein [Xanthomonas pisi DSM 18956]PPU68174.1 copper homeostasis protein [Xanthomonas pisi]